MLTPNLAAERGLIGAVVAPDTRCALAAALAVLESKWEPSRTHDNMPF